MLERFLQGAARNKEQIFSLGASLMRSFSRFLIIILASFFLTADKFGICNIFFAVYFFARVLSDGAIYLPYVKYFSEGRDDGPLINSHAVVLKVLFVGAVSLVLLAGADWFTAISGLQEKKLIYLLPPMLVSFSFYSFFCHYLNASLKMGKLFLLETIQCLLLILFFLYGYFFSNLDQVEPYIVIMTLSFVASGIVGLLLNGRHIHFTWVYDSEVTRKMLGYAKYSVVIYMGTILFLKADILMLGYFTSAEAVGIYGVALIVSEIMNVILEAIQKVCLPTASFLNAQGSSSRINSLFRQSVKNAYLLSVPVVLAVVALTPLVLRLAYKGVYDQALPIVIILAVAAVMKPVGYIAGTLITAVGYARIDNMNCWATAVLNIVLNLFFIPLWGIVGAAVATIFSYVALSLLQFYAFKRVVGREGNEVVNVKQ